MSRCLEIYSDAEIWHELEIRPDQASARLLAEVHVKSGREGHTAVGYAGRRHDEGTECLKGKVISGSGPHFQEWGEPVVSESISCVKITSQQEATLKLFAVRALDIYDFIIASGDFSRYGIAVYPWIKSGLKGRTSSYEPSVSEVESMCCGYASIWIFLCDDA